MFLSEKELRNIFWKNYNHTGRAVKYQFEALIRDGGADLVTIEKYIKLMHLNLSLQI